MMPIDEAPKLAPFTLRGHNPDVLNTIANLSNDEVFTPPELANQMLDMLERAWADGNNGANIWADHTVTFLDPFTKSGVFLREITARLVKGLEEWMPDLQQRVNHILTKQVFGIGITQLTSLLARRSVYCSKSATSKHSIVKTFDRDWGNIWFERTEHTWAGGTEKVITMDENGKTVLKATNGRCKYCGASQKEYERSDALESHAYAFIHTDDIKARMAELFGDNMHFDVVIGNPPYQMTDGGGEGASATPLYNLFVENAKALEPKQLVMVIPARWYSGGKGLDSFRSSMLTDGKLAEVHDFPETDMIFPGVNIRGGICYFRWDSNHSGNVRVVNYSKSQDPVSAVRSALEPGLSTFVRQNAAISILNKVRRRGEPSMSDKVRSRNPFGIPSNFTDFSTTQTNSKPILLFRSRRGSNTDKAVYVADSAIKTNRDLVAHLKVLVSKASPGGDEYPHAVLGTPFVAPAGSVCTETYLIVDLPEGPEEAKNLVTYMQTKFFRFLVSLMKTTQNISKSSFQFVPQQDLSIAWTDDLLFEKYGIVAEEQRFIDTLVRAKDQNAE